MASQSIPDLQQQVKLREVEVENAQLKLGDTKLKLEIAQLKSVIAHLQSVIALLQSEKTQQQQYTPAPQPPLSSYSHPLLQQAGLLDEEPNWLVQELLSTLDASTDHFLTPQENQEEEEDIRKLINDIHQS
ncbi:hypothetical protein BGX34_008497 [Mortierella sp. NVP85]|nr:hypothetical protein BGX34_008497 [Mortierella sp. NVP85]